MGKFVMSFESYCICPYKCQALDFQLIKNDLAFKIIGIYSSDLYPSGFNFLMKQKLIKNILINTRAVPSAARWVLHLYTNLFLHSSWFGLSWNLIISLYMF